MRHCKYDNDLNFVHRLVPGPRKLRVRLYIRASTVWWSIDFAQTSRHHHYYIECICVFLGNVSTINVSIFRHSMGNRETMLASYGTSGCEMSIQDVSTCEQTTDTCISSSSRREKTFFPFLVICEYEIFGEIGHFPFVLFAH